MNMSGMSVDDQSLRRLLLSRPESAMKILYAAYYRQLVRIALDLTHDPEVSEDIAQEVFAHVWSNARKLGRHHERSILHYLVKVVRNKSMSSYKEHAYIRKQVAKFSEEQQSDAFTDSPEAEMIRVEMHQELRDLIFKLPKRESQCLTMRIDEELSNQEIADRLNVSVKAVERSITSGKKRLRVYLGRKKTPAI